MFVNVDNHIKVKLYYLKNGRTYDVFTPSEFDSLKLRESEKTKYQVLKIVMKQLTWGLQNDLQEKALRDLPDGTTKFHYKAFKEGKLENTIISWSTENEDGEDVPVKDKDGNNVPVNLNTFRSLSPEIAEAIVRAYDEMVLLGDDEEKK